MRLVEISREEYRILFDAGAWVFGAPFAVDEQFALSRSSDANFPEYRNIGWYVFYTRIEEDV